MTHYRHAPPGDHGDLDAVLVSAPGRPTLPVRLTLEVFGRACARAGSGPVTVWDPCCGAGGTLAVLGLCRGEQLSGLVGTDVDADVLSLARRNLALLDAGGLAARAEQLDGLARRHAKPGYAASAAAARRLATASRPGIPHDVTVADASDPGALAPVARRHRPRVVLADLPHGRQTEWTGADDAGIELVTALSSVLAPDAVIAVVGRGRRIAVPEGTRTLERLHVGHRAAVLLRAGDVPGARIGPSGS